jgi:hypothetical protein
MAEYLKKYFEPQSDITAFELAIILQHLNLKEPVRFTNFQWDILDDHIRRHFNQVQLHDAHTPANQMATDSGEQDKGETNA